MVWNETDGLEAGARNILSAAGAQLDGLIRRSLRLGLKLMAVVLLCGLAEGACLEGRSGGLQAVELAGALAVTALTVKRHDGDGGPGTGDHRQDG